LIDVLVLGSRALRGKGRSVAGCAVLGLGLRFGAGLRRLRFAPAAAITL